MKGVVKPPNYRGVVEKKKRRKRSISKKKKKKKKRRRKEERKEGVKGGFLERLHGRGFK